MIKESSMIKVLREISIQTQLEEDEDASEMHDS